MFDIGANLTHRALRPGYRDLLNAATATGVNDISITAAHPDNTRLALAMIEAADSQVVLTTTTGLHPHLAAQYTPAMGQRMRSYAAHPAVAAIGETGLDYFRMLASVSEQQQSFRAQLDLACELNMPVFLHQRDAHSDFVAILRDYRPHLCKVVVHCFTDSRAALEDYLALNCYIGITGWICDIKRGAILRQLVADIPDDSLLLETDAPYLLPPEALQNNWTDPQLVQLSQRYGRNNLPHYLPLVLRQVAVCREQQTAHLAQLTTANARAFFGGRHLCHERAQ